MLLSNETTLVTLGNITVMQIVTVLVHTYQYPRVQNQGVVILAMKGS